MKKSIIGTHSLHYVLPVTENRTLKIFRNSIFTNVNDILDTHSVHTVCDNTTASSSTGSATAVASCQSEVTLITTHFNENREKVAIGRYVLVQYLDRKTRQSYVGQVIKFQNDELEVNYMRRADEIGRAFTFSNIVDIDSCVQMCQVVQVLDDPNMDNKLKYWFKEPILVYK